LSVLPKREADDKGRLAAKNWRKNATAEIPMQQPGVLPGDREAAMEKAPRESEEGEEVR